MLIIGILKGMGHSIAVWKIRIVFKIFLFYQWRHFEILENARPYCNTGHLVKLIDQRFR